MLGTSTKRPGSAANAPGPAIRIEVRMTGRPYNRPDAQTRFLQGLFGFGLAFILGVIFWAGFGGVGFVGGFVLGVVLAIWLAR
jgi:hypothetical protein